jgi:hypothetical protein
MCWLGINNEFLARMLRVMDGLELHLKLIMTGKLLEKTLLLEVPYIRIRDSQKLDKQKLNYTVILY